MDELDDVLMTVDRESLMKIYFQLNFLLLLLTDQEFLADGFHSKLLATGCVGEEITPGERSLTKQFSPPVDLTGTGGSVNQESRWLDVIGS